METDVFERKYFKVPANRKIADTERYERRGVDNYCAGGGDGDAVCALSPSPVGAWVQPNTSKCSTLIRGDSSQDGHDHHGWVLFGEDLLVLRARFVVNPPQMPYNLSEFLI